MRSSDSQRRAWAHRAEGEREGRGNRLLLALTLLDLAPERRSEALDLLKQVEGLTPRASMRIEDLAMRMKARDRLTTGRVGETT